MCGRHFLKQISKIFRLHFYYETLLIFEWAIQKPYFLWDQSFKIIFCGPQVWTNVLSYSIYITMNSEMRKRLLTLEYKSENYPNYNMWESKFI